MRKSKQSWCSSLTLAASVVALAAACSTEETVPLPAVADSGFDLRTDAFSFENFSDGYASSQMTADLMTRMFGAKAVCANKEVPCQLTPAAESWLAKANGAMAGGRCEGFAVLSSLFFLGVLKPRDFGSDSVRGLSLDSNLFLQEELAYWFSTQLVPEVSAQPTKRHMVKTALPFLASFLKPGAEETYRIGIVRKTKAGLSGGHSLTPIGYFKGEREGLFYLRVYDNNFPDEERKITLDLNTNRWEYQASANPNEAAALYYGDPSNNNPLYFAPVKRRTGILPCRYCRGARGTQVVVEGGAEVSSKDPQGNVTGMVDGEVVESGGGRVEPSFSGQEWNDSAPIALETPDGDATLTVAGRPDDGTSSPTARIAVFGSGFAVEARALTVSAGQSDTMAVVQGGSRVDYVSTSGTAIDLSASIERENGTILKIEIVVPAGATHVGTSVDPVSGELKATAEGTVGKHVTLKVTKVDPEKGITQTGTVTAEGSATGSLTVQADAWAPGTPLAVMQDKGDGRPPTPLTDGCDDGKKNGKEADVDCGGVCAQKCALGQGCAVAADCASLACHAVSKTCVSTPCDDGVKNGAETDLDCGGGTCNACAAGRACAVAGDCASGACVNLACAADKTVFISSVAYDGNLGGLAGADAKCQTLATAATLAGSYKAFLSDGATTAAVRLSRGTGKYVLVDKTLVAPDANTFFSFMHLHGISRDENGVELVGAEVWTGSDGSGGGAGGCLDWTSAAVGAPPAVVGLSSAADATWANVYDQICDRQQRLYCVEQ